MITPVQKKKFWDARSAGYSIAQSAKRAKISNATAYRILRADKDIDREIHDDTSAGLSRRAAVSGKQLDGPRPYDDLCDEAKRALEDFGYFRRRYFGRISTPWQEQAGAELVRLLETPDKEYVVMNMPPGSGKTTLIHDIICWCICRNRGVRLIYGHATFTQAKRGLGRVKRSLERVIPETADEQLIKRGLALDAETTMAHDFGRFKPLDKELWTNEAFIVMQPDDQGAISEKEPTLSAYGMDSGFLGSRVDGCFWDDLVDEKKVRSVEQRERLEDWWQDIAETRLEPAGLCALIGQRLAADDLYRFALDMVQPLEDDEMDLEADELAIALSRKDKKYKHLIYRAHYEDRCDPAFHKVGAAPYPEGCLLDPRRIPWREISNLMGNRGERFQVIYQQEDLAPDETLVNKEWVNGCYDKDRDRWEFPLDASGRPRFHRNDCFVVATADPSPTQFWSVQLWVYHPDSEQRFLIDLERKRMEAPDFLDWNYALNDWTGIMEEWRQLSVRVGYPIDAWVVERNAAQRFLFQYDHFKRWQSKYGVTVIQHDTGMNKADPDYGVTTISGHWKFARVRLMGKGEGKVRSLRLVDEVTRYPHGRTDDCVMAEWFFEWNLPNLYRPKKSVRAAQRPSWVRRASIHPARI